MSKTKSDTTVCGTCWTRFTGKTPQEAAKLLKDHYALVHPAETAKKREAVK